MEKVEEAEKRFFENQTDFNWGTDELKNLFEKDDSDKTAVRITEKILTEKRRISKTDISNWLSAESRYGAFLSGCLEKEEINEFSKMLCDQQGSREWDWHSVYAIISR